MILLLGAFTIGLILALLAFGVYLSFRVFNFPDITAEGSITLGAALSATLLVRSLTFSPRFTSFPRRTTCSLSASESSRSSRPHSGLGR